ncbi:MAG: peptidylprolyl isomerase [Candidatus Zixiibacteriota bacterium]
MIFKRAFWILSLAIVAIASPLLGWEPVEKIVAVVGNEPIMASELAAQIQIMAIQGMVKVENQEQLEKLQKDVLDNVISERLFLIAANEDTLIKVTQDEIDQAVDEQIARVSNQFETEEQFFAELSSEGLNLRSYKKQLQPEIKNQLLKQKLIGMKLSEISVSHQEVYDFYEKFKDSIPEQPEAVRLAHILITFRPSNETEEKVKKEAEAVREKAIKGADFSTLAVTYSTGPTALTGGDLGYISRGDVVEEFGRVAFNLSPGDISSVVRSPLGYHVIKCEDVRGDKAHLRHVLMEVVPTAADSARSYHLIDSLLNEIKNGTDFKELAKIFSADDDSRKQGGELGWFAIKDLPPEFIEALNYLVNINDTYGSVKSQYGLHILKKLDYQEGRQINPETDFDKIKEMARQSKTGEFVDNWLNEIRKKTYVDIRL